MPPKVKNLPPLRSHRSPPPQLPQLPQLKESPSHPLYTLPSPKTTNDRPTSSPNISRVASQPCEIMNIHSEKSINEKLEHNHRHEGNESEQSLKQNEILKPMELKPSSETQSHQNTIEELKSEIRRLQKRIDELEQEKAGHDSFRENQSESPDSLHRSQRKPHNETPKNSDTSCFSDALSFRTSLGSFLGVDERCVTIEQNGQDAAQNSLSNLVFSDLMREPVTISLLSPFIRVTVVNPRNVNRSLRIGRFENLGTLRKKIADLEGTDVRCIEFLKLRERSTKHDTFLLEDTSILTESPSKQTKIDTIELVDEVELHTLTKLDDLELLVNIVPQIIRVTLRTNNLWTTVEMNRFERMNSLVGLGGSLCGLKEDDVTLWCDRTRVNSSHPLDSLSPHFTHTALQPDSGEIEGNSQAQMPHAFWVPEAPSCLSLDVMGKDYEIGVKVVCGKLRKEYFGVSCLTTGEAMKKMVGDDFGVDWRRLRLWTPKDRTKNTEKKANKKGKNSDGGTNAKQNVIYVSDVGKLKNLTRRLTLTLHGRIAQPTVSITARTSKTSHSLEVKSWERIEAVRKEIEMKMGKNGERLSLFWGEKELRDWHIVGGLTEGEEMEISVQPSPPKLSIGVTLNGREQHLSMSVWSTLRALSHMMTHANPNLSSSLLTFTHNNTPITLSTRLISLGFSSSLVLTTEPKPSTSSRPHGPSRMTRIPTVIRYLSMDIKTQVYDDTLDLNPFPRIVDFAQLSLINTKTGSLVPLTLSETHRPLEGYLSTPLTFADLTEGTLNLRAELSPEFVVVRVMLEGRQIEMIHTALQRTALSSLSTLRKELTSAIQRRVFKFFHSWDTDDDESYYETNEEFNPVNVFRRDFILPPLSHHNTVLTDDTFFTLLDHPQIDLTCSTPLDTTFLTLPEAPNCPTFVLPSFIPVDLLDEGIERQIPKLGNSFDSYRRFYFVNGCRLSLDAQSLLGTLPGSPFLTLTVPSPDAKTQLKVTSVTGSTKFLTLSSRFNQYHLVDMLKTYTDPAFRRTRNFYYLNQSTKLEKELGTNRDWDVWMEWVEPNPPSFRAIDNSNVDLSFVDADGVKRLHRRSESHQRLPRYLTSLVEKTALIRIVEEDEELVEDDDEKEEDGEGDDERESEDEEEDEWEPDKTDDEDDDDEHLDPRIVRPRYLLSNCHVIDPTYDSSEYDSSTETDLSSGSRKVVQLRHRKIRKRRELRKNQYDNVVLAPKYPLLPKKTSIILHLMKLRVLCRIRGEMNKTVEQTSVHLWQKHRGILGSLDETVLHSLSDFLSVPQCLLQLKKKKIGQRVSTVFETTKVESVSVVMDVVMNKSVVPVSVRVLSGLMECDEVTGKLNESHFSFSLPLTTSFLTLERSVREKLPALGNVCWSKDTEENDDDKFYNSPYFQSDPLMDLIRFSVPVLNPLESIHSGDTFPSLPIKLTAIESLLPDCETGIVSIDGKPKAFIARTHSIEPVVAVWPPTTIFTEEHSLALDDAKRMTPFPPHSLLPSSFIADNPFLQPKFSLDDLQTSHTKSHSPTVESVYKTITLEQKNIKRENMMDHSLTARNKFYSDASDMRSEAKSHICNTHADPGDDEIDEQDSSCPSEENALRTVRQLWIETPLRRVMGLFAGSATVHDVMFFLESLHGICASLSFHKHALFAGELMLEPLLTVSEIINRFGSTVALKLKNNELHPN